MTTRSRIMKAKKEQNYSEKGISGMTKKTTELEQVREIVYNALTAVAYRRVGMTGSEWLDQQNYLGIALSMLNRMLAKSKEVEQVLPHAAAGQLPCEELLSTLHYVYEQLECFKPGWLAAHGLDQATEAMRSALVSAGRV